MACSDRVPPNCRKRASDRMKVVYGEECDDISRVRRWAACVSDGQIEHVALNLSDKRQSGRP
jgi:hypothetical protein